ncbi:hypothetical protein P3X46_029038 [Hevea brasiliensis]|uniref:Tonoplast intrinsic protein n=1 Tax=Hevea brasiliensis TaxID=3981 RepID=A0ABQ9KRU3_HEVBR|nr:hypothetical protein P3X46_029038 [Hevea brasiliensis]
MKAALAEFVSTLIFVFAGEGSVLALDKLYRETGPPASGLVMIALAHALALFSAVSASINISALVGGRISVLRALYYWVAQLLGSIVASLLLRLVTNRMWDFYVASGAAEVHGLILEMVMTFGLAYTVYATAVDTNRGSLGIIAPLAIGLIVGANILVGGPFDGASMNPARAFGPALVGWRWRNHWIYWLGPFIRGGLAALIYEHRVIPTEPLPHHIISLWHLKITSLLINLQVHILVLANDFLLLGCLYTWVLV